MVPKCIYLCVLSQGLFYHFSAVSLELAGLAESKHSLALASQVPVGVLVL